jgi:ABC-type Zn2+ transport system substrate-binding protein/surface adhesin
VIAAELAEADPANAATYAANAEAAGVRIDAAAAEAAATLEAARDRPIVVFHDAYGYFARAFDIEIAGSIALGDAAAPGAQRLRELQERIGDDQIACVFREPQHDASIAESGRRRRWRRVRHARPVGLLAHLRPRALRDAPDLARDQHRRVRRSLRLTRRHAGAAHPVAPF